MPMRWRWPPDSRTPRSPTKVVYFSGQVSMMPEICACLAACRTRPRSMRSFGTPNAIFSAILFCCRREKSLGAHARYGLAKRDGYPP